MESARIPGPASARGSSEELQCSAVSQLVRRFLAGDEDVERRPAVRAHLSRCSSCREQYHASVETVARLANAPQAYYDGLSRAPRNIHGARGFQRVKSAGARRTTLVKLILPAFGLYAAFAMSSRAEADRDVRLSTLSGVVQVGEHMLGIDDEAAMLSRSQSGSTDAVSRAQIEASDAVLIVEPSTAFAIERLHPLRVRLFEGVLLFNGSVVISTNAGVVEASPGSGVLRITTSDVDVAVADGAVAFYDSHARVVVSPQKTLHAPLPAMPTTPN